MVSTGLCRGGGGGTGGCCSEGQGAQGAAGQQEDCGGDSQCRVRGTMREEAHPTHFCD